MTEHVHVWNTDRKPCSCGAPVPAYLLAAWDRYANRIDLPVNCCYPDVVNPMIAAEVHPDRREVHAVSGGARKPRAMLKIRKVTVA